VNLPESYNGLGPRNLIFILLKLLEFFRNFTATEPAAGSCLVFIEEPEAHLHPQMQNVFIRKLSEIAKLFGDTYNDGRAWPVQFVVTTHSSHIANEAPFDSMRYFLSRPGGERPGIFAAVVRDLCAGLGEEDPENREFLHKYMTLTRCDLLFADRSILVEGSTERLLLPKMIEKIDEGEPIEKKLGSQYVSIMEVGGAYAHIFFNLLDFLQLRTLIITDIDTIDADDSRRKCKVSEGTHSSNACINRWYAPEDAEKPTKDQLMAKSPGEKLSNVRRLAFQIPHSDGDACGRSFEDAFMLANPALFDISGHTPEEREEQAWEAAKAVDKTDFALKYAIEKTDWKTPRYIEEGLRWLSEPPMAIAAPEEEPVEGTPADVPLDTECHGND
jgi:predicted ATP-dependent endonuclease of OLD family